MRTTVKIDGVAICYYDSAIKAHKVIFPFDPKHDHAVMIRKDGTPQQPLASAGRRVVLNAQPRRDSRPFSAENLEEFIDITASYAHSNGVELVDGWEANAVHLTLHNATFIRESLTTCNFGLFESATETLEPRRVTYNASYLINADRISVDISGSELPGYRSPIELSNGSEITISNTCTDCPGGDQDADFRMIYEVVMETGFPQRRLRMDRQADQKPPQGGEKAIFSNSFVLKIIELILSLFGRSSPGLFKILNNPGIGKAGLPCNIVAASDSDNLP